MISNQDLNQAAPQFAAGWWTSKTKEEQAWYRKFWAACR
jgi:hypothetical protein